MLPHLQVTPFRPSLLHDSLPLQWLLFSEDPTCAPSVCGWNSAGLVGPGGNWGAPSALPYPFWEGLLGLVCNVVCIWVSHSIVQRSWLEMRLPCEPAPAPVHLRHGHVTAQGWSQPDPRKAPTMAGTFMSYGSCDLHSALRSGAVTVPDLQMRKLRPGE